MTEQIINQILEIDKKGMLSSSDVDIIWDNYIIIYNNTPGVSKKCEACIDYAIKKLVKLIKIQKEEEENKNIEDKEDE